MVSIVLFHSTASGLAGFFSGLIADAEGSPQRISHSALKTEVNGVPWILHAAWGGVAFIPMSEIMGNHTVVAEFEIIPDYTTEFEAAKGRIGQAYDVLTLIGYIPVILGRFLHIGINNPFYSKSAEVCSQLIVETDTDGKLPEFRNLDAANVSPQDLFNICSVSTNFKRVV